MKKSVIIGKRSRMGRKYLVHLDYLVHKIAVTTFIVK